MNYNPELFETGPVYIYRNKNVWPRVYLASGVIASAPAAVLTFPTFYSIAPLSVFVHDRELENISGGGVSADDSVTIKRYGLNDMEIECSLSKRNILVISDHFDTGWKYSVDSRPARVYRVNYCMRGLILEKGRHRVYGRYSPDALPLGFILCAVGVLMLAGGYLWLSQNH